MSMNRRERQVKESDERYDRPRTVRGASTETTRHHRALVVLTLAGVLFGTVISPAQPRAGQRQPIRAASPLLYYESNPSQIIETFALMREANAGSSAAMHELGYRYLFGRGIAADTAKAAEWIIRAADRGMALAEYNAGILHTHAIGVPWNPFQAFQWFRKAAEKDQPAALYIYGLLHTDGLLVRPHWGRAWSLVAEAASKGYEPAKEMLVEFRRLGIDTLRMKSRIATDTSASLLYLQFGQTSNPTVSDTTLARELAREVPADRDGPSSAVVEQRSDAAELSWILRQAERGIPEAHVVLARIYEKGIGVPKDLVRAAVHYQRANRLDSPRAPAMLAELTHQDAFIRELTERTLSGDRDARYVWASLAAIGFDERIGIPQARKMLEENTTTSPRHGNSLLELGMWYATGRHVKQDPAMAVALWQKADSAGVKEGRIRSLLALLALDRETAGRSATFIRSEADSGSVLAQAALAFCLEQGVGMAASQPEAASMYRKAAQRGSQMAYRNLRRMYDALRPDLEEFRIE